MIRIDHPHTVEPQPDGSAWCDECHIVLPPLGQVHGLTADVQPTADGDGNHGVDVSLHLEIGR